MYVKNITDGPLLDVAGNDFAEVDIRNEPYASFYRKGWLVQANPAPDEVSRTTSSDASGASDKEQSSQAPKSSRSSRTKAEGN